MDIRHYRLYIYFYLKNFISFQALFHFKLIIFSKWLVLKNNLIIRKVKNGSQ